MALEDKYELTGLLTEDCQYVRFNHWKVFQKALGKFVGKDVKITIEILRYKRSAAQNRFIHGVVVPTVRGWLFDTQGIKFDHDQVYAWLRTTLLEHKMKVTDVAGEQIVTMTGKRFSKMNSKEFSEAIEEIRHRMDARGCHIPEPKKKAHNFVEDYLTDD